MNEFSPMLAAAGTGSTLSTLDWLIILAYFGVLAGIAWWVIKKNKDISF